MSKDTAKDTRAARIERLRTLHDELESALALAQKAVVYANLGWLSPEMEAQAPALYQQASVATAAQRLSFSELFEGEKIQPLIKGVGSAERSAIVERRNKCGKLLHQLARALQQARTAIADAHEAARIRAQSRKEVA